MPYILLNAEGTVASKAGQSLTSGSLQAAVEKVSYKDQCLEPTIMTGEDREAQTELQVRRSHCAIGTQPWA